MSNGTLRLRISSLGILVLADMVVECACVLNECKVDESTTSFPRNTSHQLRAGTYFCHQRQLSTRNRREGFARIREISFLVFYACLTTYEYVCKSSRTLGCAYLPLLSTSEQGGQAVTEDNVVGRGVFKAFDLAGLDFDDTLHFLHGDLHNRDDAFVFGKGYCKIERHQYHSYQLVFLPPWRRGKGMKS